MSWLGLMPLRGGSKSIADKNIYPLAGRPLFAWSLEQAILSNVFDQLVVATDCATIHAAVVREFGSSVEIVGRSPESATDTASSETIMLEISAALPSTVMALIQATSPLTQAAHFADARTLFENKGLDSLLTAVRCKRFIWSERGAPLSYEPARRPRRQDYAGILIENGAFYYTRTEILEHTQCRLGGRTGIFEMPQDTAIEIDEPEDIAAVERLLLKRERTGSAPVPTVGTGNRTNLPRNSASYGGPGIA